MDLLDSGATVVSAVPAIVPSVINLSNALAPVEQHSEGCVWHMLMVAFVPFLSEATALQVLVSAHACLEAAGATLGQPIQLAAKCAQSWPMPDAQTKGTDAMHARASLQPVAKARFSQWLPCVPVYTLCPRLTWLSNRFVSQQRCTRRARQHS
jgi:hypothetical protein